MQFKGTEEEWNSWRNVNSDPYGKAIFNYALRWADMMEAAIESGSRLEDVASNLSHEADTDGITGAMYGMAVAVLSQVWIHGDALRKWHNRQYGADDSEGVVNPAMLVIKSNAD